ncbi:RIP metalloprotease RseP [Niveispirillum sp. SYP-B3756]|uniref:RIP metalloprotease RseP n=1 Tax=Niveispirillum sp. SYP-B3756 TaxID=2662178 RepID=UPI001292280D|nr:RIP metalloprotease RseP [Niveispirillum sp. SYP-B3756]MQP67643.1 RIP metalloprotease RseP [Niveispirillum sp. SYP-B3756]
MEVLSFIWNYGIMFLVVLTILVFVHEMGHFLLARRNGVRVEVFSVGFGPEIFGRTDRHGTRWKFSAVPLGGYVKMFGDAGAASTPGDGLNQMSAADRAVSFHHKRVGQRMAIVVAGPMANFLFAIVAFAFMFMVYGQPYSTPVVLEVAPDGAANEAGMKPGDRIIQLEGASVERFEDVLGAVIINPGKPLHMVVQRAVAGEPEKFETHEIVLTPRHVKVEDRFGNVHTIGRMGVIHGGYEYRRHTPLKAVWEAVKETVGSIEKTLGVIWQMIKGERETTELGGFLGIAQMTGQVVQENFVTVLWFMAGMSISLGLINLFPIPMLDGGHLLYYALEAVRGRPLGERAQEYGFRVGLALVLSLMLFATWNDLVRLRVVDFVKNVLS